MLTRREFPFALMAAALPGADLMKAPPRCIGLDWADVLAAALTCAEFAVASRRGADGEMRKAE